MIPEGRWLVWIVLVFAMLCPVPLWAAPVPLSSLAPVSVYSFYPGQDGNPTTAKVKLFGEASSESALRFISESEISYKVPTGESTFSAILSYNPRPLEVPGNEPPGAMLLLVRIRVNGRQVLEEGFDGEQPPFEFTVPVNPGAKLTISSLSSFLGAEFYLARAGFSSEWRALTSTFLAHPGEGYVDCTPVPRQAVVHAFFPGEKVNVVSVYGGAAADARVSLQFSPDGNGSSSSAATLILALRPGPDGVARGESDWQVPLHLGPARLTITESVNGQNVFYRELRVSVLPRTDLAGVSHSLFGVHISTTGYRMLFDEFAYLWGAKWARIFVRWPVLEPSPGQFDFSRVDELVDVYRSQNMRLLVALGEDAPKWVGSYGPNYQSAWKRYVSAVVKHLSEKVEYWDVFNEIDNKYDVLDGKFPAEWDIEVLRAGLEGLHAADPRAKTVCCSTGGTNWLAYDKKIFQAGLLKDIDIVSLHPYRSAAPEEQQGSFTYLDEIHALEKLEASFGYSRPVWATEANWILGPRGAPNVTAPELDEQKQADYVVRSNLLSYASGVPYFLHAPFEHRMRPHLHLATLSAYANMTSLLSNALKNTMLASGPEIFGIVSQVPPSYVGAVWSSSPGNVIGLSGEGSYRFTDSYGNAMQMDPESLGPSESPIYFRSSSIPQLQVLREQQRTQWRTLEQVAHWSCHSGTRCSPEGQGIHVVSQPSKYAYQLISPPIAVEPRTCQLARVSIKLEQGSVGFFAIDANSGVLLTKVAYANFVPDGQFHQVEVKFDTGESSSVKLVLANANLQEAVSSFSVADAPMMAACH